MTWVFLATRRGWAMDWPELGWIDLVYLVTFFVVMWLLYQLAMLALAVHRSMKRIGPYWRVAGAAGLSVVQRWHLLCIARRSGLSTPLSLMLSSGTLYHHARLYEQSLDDRRAERMRGAVRRIAVCLYGPNRA